ncbi:MAG: xanthine dehydrogenase [Chloroflexi bacterium HGW-Chloroflexi-7]|nr:MAG: xanthine dehydrogenase [Chloroflexi bacterium HGW-Chloroflexi-7]HCS39662.1 xanthine dehydrogenase [Anaerolineaceae bacterium]
MAERMTLTINGKEQTVDYEPEMMLLDVLREVLNLTGTKHGCDNSTCGTCTVVMDGKAIKSCNTPAAKAAGTSIVTVEGLAKGMDLHPIQKAISESGAVQCGFCTPGIVMELYGLLEANPDASEVEMTNALNKHLCRCTGYEPIRDGAMIAQKMIKETRK